MCAEHVHGGDRAAGFARRTFVLPIRAYQALVSPFLPPSCRFEPSCSEFAARAILAHGILQGGALAVGRILRCHPFHSGGYDPVPPVAE